jgi:hypothetical protein
MSYQSSRPWGTIEPDKRYNLGHVDVQFEVPLGVSWEFMQVLAYPTIQKAIEQFEKIGKWQFLDKAPIQYAVSAISSAGLLPMINSPLQGLWGQEQWHKDAADALGSDTVTMVARVMFIRPLVWINEDEEAEYKKELGKSIDGYVSEEDLPEGWKEQRKNRPTKKETSHA